MPQLIGWLLTSNIGDNRHGALKAPDVVVLQKHVGSQVRKSQPHKGNDMEARSWHHGERLGPEEAGTMASWLDRGYGSIDPAAGSRHSGNNMFAHSAKFKYSRDRDYVTRYGLYTDTEVAFKPTYVEGKNLHEARQIRILWPDREGNYSNSAPADTRQGA